jgi:biopolymer transport protein ExbB/TolQ
LILLGVIIGYLIGSLVMWYCSVEDLIEIAKRKEGMLSLDLFVKESKVKSLFKEAMERTTELPKLKEEVKTLRIELYKARSSKGEQKMSYEAALRKTKSLENELVKAKAKIRRLKKKQSPGKWTDAEP